MVRRADFWYIAYGDLQSLANEKFLGELISLSEESASGIAIPTAELAKRKITLSMPPGHEGFAHVLSHEHPRYLLDRFDRTDPS